jgi:hypothetical protein
MPKRDRYPLGAPCWADILTTDVQRAREFYGRVLSWTATEPDEELGGYVQFLKDGVPVAGCIVNQSAGAVPDMWNAYFCSADAGATLVRATELGGRVILPSTTVGNLGTMGVIIGPDGAATGVWAPRDFHGFGLYHERGAASWFELRTSNYGDAVAFYRELFEWKTSVSDDGPGPPYTTVVCGGEAVAGIMDAASSLGEKGVPHWSVYFGVADVDDAMATIVEQGGRVLRPAQDTAYGRLAMAADPGGTQFRLMSCD